jgi:hypothetical protein
MPIYINKNGQQSGPYEDHIVIDQLRSGMLSPDDMAIRHGGASWQRLGDMFPEAVRHEPSTTPRGAGSGASAAVDSPVKSAAEPSAKKGGCLKGGLIGLGVLLLLLGIATAAGSRFIPSPSCDLAKSDAEKIDKLKRDLDKAKAEGDYDEVGPLSIELKAEEAGAATSQKYCDDDKFRDNIILAVGGVVGVFGLLMAIVGLFVGRRK